ncbi:MAG: hypothetical protein AAFX58_11725 [Pseudomonadota bacterium]
MGANESSPLTRRRLLARGLAALTIAGVAPGCGDRREAGYAAAGAETPDPQAMWLAFAQTLAPGNNLDTQHYDSVVERFALLRADAATAAMLDEGLRRLDTSGVFPAGSLAERTAVLESMAATPVFGLLRFHAINALYSDPAVWELYGYQGPSFPHGGYLNRGFDDLDWLPPITRTDDAEGRGI